MSVRIVRSLLALAAPVVASQAASMMVSIADTLMVGRLGNEPLGAVSFATNISVPVSFFGIGIATIATPFISRRFGRGDMQSISRLIGHSRRLNLVLAFALTAILIVLNALMPYMGQPREVCNIALTYLPLLTASVFCQQLFMGGKAICEGLQDTRTPMAISVCANVLNIVGNYVFIFGFGPISPMGVYGAALSTLISRFLMWITMEIILRRKLRTLKLSSTTISRGSLSWRLFLCGLPIGLQTVLEMCGFALGGLMMGWLGADALAAHQVVNLFISLTYLMAGGVATAVTIKVSVNCGVGNFRLARSYALYGMLVSLLFMSCSTVLFISLRNVLPGLIIDSAAAVAIGAQLMLAGGACEIFDGLQVTAIGALRGYADFRFPALAAGLAFVLCGLPIGYLFAFTLDFGPVGIWMGYVSGLIVACSLLLFRLRRFIK